MIPIVTHKKRVNKSILLANFENTPQKVNMTSEKTLFPVHLETRNLFCASFRHFFNVGISIGSTLYIFKCLYAGIIRML